MIITTTAIRERRSSCEAVPSPCSLWSLPPTLFHTQPLQRPHLLRLNWMAKSDMTCRALFVSTRSMEMEPTCRLKVPEISSPLAFMAGSQTWVKETRNPWEFTQSEPFGALHLAELCRVFVNQGHFMTTNTVSRGTVTLTLARAAGCCCCCLLQTLPHTLGNSTAPKSER